MGQSVTNSEVRPISSLWVEESLVSSRDVGQARTSQKMSLKDVRACYFLLGLCVRDLP